MNYYISNLHLLHRNVTRAGNNFDDRPFDNLKEMHSIIKEKWNTKVTHDDMVYILWDIAMHGRQEEFYFKKCLQDMNTDDLFGRIARLMVSEKQMTITGAAMNKLRKTFDIVREEKDYGNGRFVRKTLEEAEMNLAERALQFKKSEITTELITTIEECDIPDLNIEKRMIKRIGFAC